jgi:hypothetical protein
MRPWLLHPFVSIVKRETFGFHSHTHNTMNGQSLGQMFVNKVLNISIVFINFGILFAEPHVTQKLLNGERQPTWKINENIKVLESFVSIHWFGFGAMTRAAFGVQFLFLHKSQLCTDEERIKDYTLLRLARIMTSEYLTQCS